MYHLLRQLKSWCSLGKVEDWIETVKGYFLGKRDSIVIKKTVLSFFLCCIITYYIRKIVMMVEFGK